MAIFINEIRLSLANRPWTDVLIYLNITSKSLSTLQKSTSLLEILALQNLVW